VWDRAGQDVARTKGKTSIDEASLKLFTKVKEDENDQPRDGDGERGRKSVLGKNGKHAQYKRLTARKVRIERKGKR